MLPPVADHEIELIVKDALSYTCAQTERSPSKSVGNFRFRVLVFPAGSNSSGGSSVSVFVEADPPEGLDPRWVFHNVKYQITVVNWHNYQKSITKSDTWSFCKDGIDRGWHDTVRTADLSRETGWLGPDNSLCIRASCYVRQADSVLPGSGYGGRKETGYVGLKNHGATCYMNGLLQSLFHVGEFRRIVYSIDCDDAPEPAGKADDPLEADLSKGSEGDDSGRVSVIQALQNVFYRLQTSDQAVNCRELMRSFGWDQTDAFTQHDAQELNRILCDRVEEQMKGTPMDGSIKRLFEGEMENYIECIEVDYKSRRNETFYDIQLNIKGEKGQELKNIEDSLRDFTSEEVLEGDNAYEAEGHGKQRARKGIRFLTFPPVLNLQLKRFHFDLEKMDMVKLNSRFEFPKHLDLSSFAPGAGSYVLHAVVVHSGDVNSGHYYAYIRPTLDEGWFKFDDDVVTPCSEYAAVEDNYGGSDLTVWNYFERSPRELASAQTPARPRIQNAYMLVYIRSDCSSEVLKPPNPQLVNSKMVERCEREVTLAEMRRREKMEQQLKIKVKIVFERDLCKMNGFWSHSDIPSDRDLKMGREQMAKDLATEVETLYGIPAEHLACFCLVCRSTPRQVRFALIPQNSPLRQHIPQHSVPHFDPSDPCLTVLIVTVSGYDMNTLKWQAKDPTKKPDDLARWHDEQVMMLVVKYFDVQKRNLVTLGCYCAQATDLIVQMVNDGWVLSRLQKYVDEKEVLPLPEAPAALQWECWEESSKYAAQLKNARASFKSQLFTGDVVIWQLRTTRDGPEEPPPSEVTGDASVPNFPVRNVAEWSAHLANSIDVTVTLHDRRQPLCVDGIISNGHWLPPRPAAIKEATGEAPAADERPEIAALQLSPATFQMPREKEIPMDLRWQANHVARTIAKAFDLPQTDDSILWLFHSTPSSTSEEPFNANAARYEPLTLKELQVSAMYTTTPNSASRLGLHGVTLPFPPGIPPLPVCVRYFDDVVREVGSVVFQVPASGTVRDILAEATKKCPPNLNLSTPFRLMEVVDSRIHKVCPPEMPVQNLFCFNKANLLYHCLRVESVGRNEENKHVVEIYHCDRQSLQAFGQPMLLPLMSGEKGAAIKTLCKEKLRLSDVEFRSWRLMRVGDSGRTPVKDEEAWGIDFNIDTEFCLEHVHPNPLNALSRHTRFNKPLKITRASANS